MFNFLEHEPAKEHGPKRAALSVDSSSARLELGWSEKKDNLEEILKLSVMTLSLLSFTRVTNRCALYLYGSSVWGYSPFPPFSLKLLSRPALIACGW